jgi:acyl carrier protein
MLDETIRRLIDEHGNLKVSASALSSDADLYEAGLTSFAAIRIMLALEEAFDVEFPERMLKRQCFGSINSIVACLDELQPSARYQLAAA